MSLSSWILLDESFNFLFTFGREWDKNKFLLRRLIYKRENSFIFSKWSRRIFIKKFFNQTELEKKTILTESRMPGDDFIESSSRARKKIPLIVYESQIFREKK